MSVPKHLEAEESRKRSLRWKADGSAASKAKQTVLARIAQGDTVDQAMAYVGRQVATYYKWREKDKAYAAEVDRTRAKLASGTYPPCPLSAETRARFFKEDYDDPINPPHLLEAMGFINALTPGQFGLILFPPEHAKTSLGEDWLNCVIADDPESRCVVVSKTESEAIKRLLKIQARFEDVDFYGDFIDIYGPFKPEGRGQRPWGAKRFSVVRKTPKQRDFSLQAIGIGGQIQGQRIDYALLDDVIDDGNYREWEVQARYIRQSVNTRLGKSGIGLMIGTRQDEMDLYRYLMDEGFFDSVLIHPALSATGDYLWPDRYSPEDYARMEIKAGPRIWALTYQQEDVVSEGQAFPLDLIESAFDPELRAQVVPQGSYVVVGIDPAATGFTAGVALAVDPRTKRRVLVDVWNERNLIGDGGDRREGVVQFILELCRLYHANRIVLEDNSAFVYVSSSPQLRADLAAMGCQLETVRASRAHHHDDALSVTLSTLFSNGVIKIPTEGASKQVYGDFIRQLSGWRPYDKKLVRDMVRAFYYAEHGVSSMLRQHAMRVANDYDESDLPDFMKGDQTPYLETELPAFAGFAPDYSTDPRYARRVV